MRVYISFEDIVLLADKYDRRIPRDTDPPGFAAEVEKKERKLIGLILEALKQVG